MGHADPQSLTARRSSVKPSHLRCGACLIKEDKPFRIEIELSFEPSATSAQDVGPFLLTGVRRLFLSVMSCRTKNLHRDACPIRMPFSDKLVRISARVMSGLS
jgi:hypothetical protein